MMPSPRRHFRPRLCLLTAVGLGACAGAQGTLAPLPKGGHHVLFNGNSLTYTNDLPGVLATMAASTRDTIYAASVTYANFALVDHLSSGSARAAIGADRWEYVILQQGPTSTTGVDRDTLILAARAFEPLIRAAGGTPALYMAWPDITRRSFWDNCRDSYRMAAQAVGGAFFPAGEAWREAWARDSTLPLYGGDGFHPSFTGTYLAALTMYERITGKDARNVPVPATIGGNPVTSTRVRLLQDAAHAANVANAARYTRR